MLYTKLCIEIATNGTIKTGKSLIKKARNMNLLNITVEDITPLELGRSFKV